MNTQDRVSVITEHRDAKRRIKRYVENATLISGPRVSPYGYVYHWCIIDPVVLLG